MLLKILKSKTWRSTTCILTLIERNFKLLWIYFIVWSECPVRNLLKMFFYLNKVKRYQIWNQIDIFIHKKIKESFKYQISLPSCFYYCSTELQFLTVAGMLSRDALSMNIGAKYFDGNSCLLGKASQVFGRKTHHIRQFEKVYGMRTIITIVKAD